MKRLIFSLVVFLTGLTSCSKSIDQPDAPKFRIKVEAYSETPAEMEVLNQPGVHFTGNITQEFDANMSEISIILHSSKASSKSIVIYVNNHEVARRSGNCIVNDYDLNYDLGQY